MAIGPTLPPQAYTREVLAVAFHWLQSQPEGIRKQAVSPDALVSLYLRAQRFNSPVSGHDCEINGSSSEMSFSSLQAPIGPQGSAAKPPPQQSFANELKALSEGLKNFDHPPSFKESSRSAAQPHAGPEMGLNLGACMSPASLSQLKEVRECFHLSSDTEALNMMVAVAHKSLLSLLR